MRLAAAALALMIATAPLAAQEGRTFVDRLPLGTPESAVTAFIDAFNAKDFATAYYMMSPEAKRTFIDSYYAYTVGRYFSAQGEGYVEGSIFSDTSDVSDGLFAEVADDTALIFDNLVFHAEANGQLPFTLANAGIDSIEMAGDDAAEVSITGAEPATLRLEMVQIYNGSWRVDQIRWAGSSAEIKPWGFGSGKTKSQ